MSTVYGKVVHVIITPEDHTERATVADVLCDIENDKNVIRFPCVKEKIGGIYFKKTTKKQGGEQRIKIVRASFAEYLKEIRRMGCEEIVFGDGSKMEV